MSLRKNLRVFPVAVTCLAACALQLAAQTTPAASTCTTAPVGVTTFSIERVLALNNILTTLTPNVPPNILAALSAGAQEIRSRLIYNPTAGTVTDTTFLVAAGSPIPTSLAIDVTQSTIQAFVLNVDRVYTSCKPTPSVMFVGTVAGSSGPYGAFNGAPAAISVGYTTDTPAKINNVVELIAGSVLAYSAGGSGTVTFPAAPVTPTGTGGGAPTITITSPNLMSGGSTQVFFNPLQVSFTGVDPNNLPLTYTFTSDKTADIKINGNTATITFQAGKGDYNITVLATNTSGVSSAPTTFTLTYLGSR